MKCPLCGVAEAAEAMERHLRDEIGYFAWQCGHCRVKLLTQADAEAHFASRFNGHRGAPPVVLEVLDPRLEQRLGQLCDQAFAHQPSRDPATKTQSRPAPTTSPVPSDKSAPLLSRVKKELSEPPEEPSMGPEPSASMAVLSTGAIDDVLERAEAAGAAGGLDDSLLSGMAESFGLSTSILDNTAEDASAQQPGITVSEASSDSEAEEPPPPPQQRTGGSFELYLGRGRRQAQGEASSQDTREAKLRNRQPKPRRMTRRPAYQLPASFAPMPAMGSASVSQGPAAVLSAPAPAKPGPLQRRLRKRSASEDHQEAGDPLSGQAAELAEAAGKPDADLPRLKRPAKQLAKKHSGRPAYQLPASFAPMPAMGSASQAQAPAAVLSVPGTSKATGETAAEDPRHCPERGMDAELSPDSPEAQPRVKLQLGSRKLRKRSFPEIPEDEMDEDKVHGGLECRLCGKRVRMGKAIHHLRAFHAPKDVPVFECLLCDYTSPAKDRMQAHVSGPHGTVMSESTVKDNSAQASEVAKSLFQEAYGVAEVKDLPPSFKLCKECGEKVSVERFRGHVATGHLRKEMWRCLKCDFVSFAHNFLATKHHMKKGHDLDRPVVGLDVEDLRPAHEAAIGELVWQCFGVKPLTTRPYCPRPEKETS